ncbi:MAG TPA: NAD(P)/FAD-dependent oxidoreductase [Rhodoglobus sp.]|nr:NAD(P)/FAD-dependent oxidoreductase [Rhodoglobus sp.]
MDAYDVIIAGGGPAGLSAALMLGRSRRSVLVLDAGDPRNARANHSHGVLGHDGLPPLQLLEHGRRELARYGVEVRRATALDARIDAAGVEVRTDAGVERARRLIVATGMADDLPDIPGVHERWGTTVVVCPYCDGWEHRDQRIGVLASGAGGVQQAQLMRQWSPDVIYFGGELTGPEPVDAIAMDARGIRIERRGIDAVVDAASVRLADGEIVELDVLFLHPRPRPRDALLRELGVATDERGWAVVDASGRTGVPNVWAVGNLVNVNTNVPVAMASGSMAGGAVNADLVAEDIALALA